MPYPKDRVPPTAFDYALTFIIALFLGLIMTLTMVEMLEGGERTTGVTSRCEGEPPEGG